MTNPSHIDFFVDQETQGAEPIYSEIYRSPAQAFSLFLSGNLGTATVRLEVTPDEFDDPEEAVWYSLPEGTFAPADFVNPAGVLVWKNADLCECAMRAVIDDANEDTVISLKMRPRVVYSI